MEFMGLAPDQVTPNRDGVYQRSTCPEYNGNAKGFLVKVDLTGWPGKQEPRR